MEIKNTLINYITQIGRLPENEIQEDTPVYSSGLLSSLKIIELMSYIEKQFEIVIRAEEFVEKNFRDIKSIITFIQMKLQGT